jgi:hypothetical protein
MPARHAVIPRCRTRRVSVRSRWIISQRLAGSSPRTRTLRGFDAGSWTNRPLRCSPAAARETGAWARDAARRMAALADALQDDPAAALDLLRAQADITRNNLRLPAAA